MEDKRIPRFQRKYLWKFQTCSFVGIPIPKTSENQPRSKLSAAYQVKVIETQLALDSKKSETKKNRGTRWPSNQDDHISTGYIGYLDWKFMRCFNISEMINDNLY